MAKAQRQLLISKKIIANMTKGELHKVIKRIKNKMK